ncbi:response regulator [Noviherbaspirillum aridicola]|uniref:Response regulatory domain-containing protein n=1 Tax=Noviherbaspirillum aridicola TaxID=2849687 RepID=A0ABQ4PYP6_9BURK|nr:response regulator [Noviherbaspirillum aridicola]GIZ49998.1 hypothetical protein NCCP691_00120 [Noviherbaspirillum aridicola]
MRDKHAASHILIVDDEDAIAYVFRRYFELHGFRVSVADDGESALAFVRSDPIDALVTDFRMPGMNGQELIARLRQADPHLPALIVSGYGNEISASLPGVRILGKPVDPAYLVACVREMLADAATVRGLQGMAD